VEQDLLDSRTLNALLSWTLVQKDRFGASEVRAGYRPDQRSSLNFPLVSADPWHARLRKEIMTLLPRVFEELSVKPFSVMDVELEVSSYGDGAFFLPHIDTVAGVPGMKNYRIISAVYYFHLQPRGFEGGELRLFRFGSLGADGDDHVDVEPLANSCVFFPSWAPHEVRQVRCPSQRFEESRFAINIWLRGRPDN
jgi:Rps23 Pro-64 3,4-dihydroxylase Tpa1-like proline 4-hydroxylase